MTLLTEQDQIITFMLHISLVWQKKATWESVPFLPHADINWPPLRHSVNTWVRRNPVKFWVQVQRPMVAYGRQNFVNKAKEIDNICMTFFKNTTSKRSVIFLN